jgi:hypothetical protein
VQALKLHEQVVGAKPLLKKLLLQMDNFVNDNKNWPCFFLVIINSKGGL